MSFADVVLPVPLDQPFTYAVPEGMEVAAGVRVLAPWGSRRLAGVVTARHARLPAGLGARPIKPLLAVLDDEPLLDEVMLRLVAWAAQYYQAPIGEVMRCALPPGQGTAPRPVRHLHAGRRPADDERLTGAQRELLAAVGAQTQGCEASAVRRQFGAARVATLLRRGLLRQIESEAPLTRPAWQPRARPARLNSSQQRALAVITAAPAAGVERRPVLLHGVTGSGKTEVYIAAIEATLEGGQSALLLVPEIGLTPALFADFEAAFPGLVAVLHSSLSDGERAAHWRRLRAGSARVAIGTRSAVFAPLPELGLIVVDEEHDASYKQQEAPRYHGRDLAVMRGKLSGARVVLGSATPSLESYRHGRAGKYELVEMKERVERRPLPAIHLVDMAAEFRRQAEAGPPRPREAAERELLFSARLRDALEDRLRRGQQSLLLINRRGFAPVVLCRSCGATVMCRDCAVSLTYHKRAGRLVCHFCGFAAEVPRQCPGCGSEHIYFLGSGSEKVEEELAALLPGARLARLDRDTARTRRHFEQVLARFRAAEFDILVGTQMIAKGHDVPGVTLVGVLQADLGLTFPDFRAAERTFQLLTQVAGRAGRGRDPGEVILQVMHPEHYSVLNAQAGDFAAFFDREANFRRWMHYPPFAALAGVQVRHAAYDRALELSSLLGGWLRQQAAAFPATRALGPAPAMLARAKAEFRFQFIFKSGSRQELGRLLQGLRDFAREQKFPATALVVDVDPLQL